MRKIIKNGLPIKYGNWCGKRLGSIDGRIKEATTNDPKYADWESENILIISTEEIVASSFCYC